MIRDLIKWVVPGLATVLGGTTLCVAMTSAGITGDLTAKTSAAMTDGGYDWAELSLDMRDIKLSGTTTDTAILQAAITRLGAIDGVRSVTSDVTLAPMASPYLLTASIAPQGVEISGGVPDETTRKNLFSRAGTASAALELRSGMPDRKAWTAGAQFAIDNLRYLDQGTISVSDLTVSLTGRAKSERDYRDLLIVMRAGPPAGLSLGAVSITPALVSPYQWSATSDGERIAVTGFVPDDAVAERLRTADVGGLPVATGLALGSGEPSGFATLSQTLLEQLAKLEHGAVSITGIQSKLTGAPPSLDVAQGIVDTLAPSGTIVVLEPPRIADYWMSTTLQPGGLMVFDGYVPDEATREAFAKHQGADTQWLKLGRGAPERYQSGADFGLSALDLMSEGRFALRDNVLTIAGAARSAADYETLRATMAQGAPQGLVLEPAEILAPRAEAYTWQVSKDGTGAVTLSGLVPTPEAKASLLAAAGAGAKDSLAYASGEPANFMASADTAIALMDLLDDGTISFASGAWTLTGTPNSPADRSAIEAQFASKKLAAAGWSMAMAQPVAAAAPQPVAPPAATEPYVWSVTKDADGTITATGNAPAASFQRFMSVRAGEGFSDDTTIAAGAPEGFTTDAVAALEALKGLSEGTAGFDGTTWSVGGELIDDAANDVVGNAITSGSTPPDEWDIALTPAPAAEPPVAEPTVIAVDPNYTFAARRSADGAVVLSGQVPADPAMRYFSAITDGDISAVSIADGAPDSFLPSAEAGLRALLLLDEGELAFANGKWSLQGVAPDDVTRSEVLTSIAADPAAATWTSAIEIPAAEPEVATPALAPAPAPVAESAPAPAIPETSAADLAACTAPVAQFSARNAIFFQSGAARIAAESDNALDELAIDLAACPSATVHIEGHTDSDGDEALNMALSVARAEAVVNALTQRGVAPERLYAVGYGETAPIADNGTAEGKRMNRRIVVTVKAGE